MQDKGKWEGFEKMSVRRFWWVESSWKTLFLSEFHDIEAMAKELQTSNARDKESRRSRY